MSDDFAVVRSIIEARAAFSRAPRALRIGLEVKVCATEVRVPTCTMQIESTLLEWGSIIAM